MSLQRAVCLNCMDGRVQIPVIDWIKNHYDVDYVDMITEPGMDGLLADPNHSLEDIRRKVELSMTKNNASMICVAGHFDCQGNPVDETTHQEHINAAVLRLTKEFPTIDIVGVWINAQWRGEAL